ncbi:MAG: GAF domain-containing protein [Myxococcales bacterium]|nr:GAF domain-containing protein [Myxococcales bacterium]
MGMGREDGGPAVPVVISLPSQVIADRLAALAASFAMADTMEELAISAQEAIETFIGAEYNGLYLWDSEACGLRLLYSVGFTDDERTEAEKTALERHPGAVFRSGEMLHVGDVEADAEGTESSPRSFSVRSRLFVPVTFRDEILGVFGLASPHPQRFGEQDIALLRFICRLAGVVYRRIIDRQEHEAAQVAIQAALEQANAELLAVQADLLATNEALEARVAARTRDLEDRNTSLKAALSAVERTQEQIIQAEKMASLGQLVAGIAHEVKNPLNFVINFAELSIELLGEVTELLGGAAEGEVTELLTDVVDNLRKIHEHGERANQTISSMLMHARERGGETVECDLNTVVREHAQLAYKAVRALDRSFFVDVEGDYDPALARVEVPLQEVSRVLVNLVSNACHALQVRAKEAPAEYCPRVRLSTRLVDGRVRIAIRDNGTGIRPEVRRRLFDPFFTTKKAGEGTGLGLSMAYDIVVKQLGGALRVESVVDEFAEFVVEFPLVREEGGG